MKASVILASLANQFLLAQRGWFDKCNLTVYRPAAVIASHESSLVRTAQTNLHLRSITVNTALQQLQQVKPTVSKHRR